MPRLLPALFLALPLTAQAADPAAYLPAETDAVLTIQARRVAESELGARLGADLMKEALRASKPAADAVQATGLDPLKDFDLITVGVDLDQAGSYKPFALFEGKFDTKKVEASVSAYMKDHPDKVQAVTVGGKSAYKLPGRKPEETMYAAIIDDTKLVVAPSEKDLTGAFAAAAGARKPVISREFASLLATARSPAPIFVRAWVKGRFNDLKLGNDQLRNRLQAVDWMTAAVAVTKDVAVTVTVNTPDEAAARQLSDILGGVIALVKIQIRAAAEDQPELWPVSDLLRSTKVTPNGKLVVAAGSVKGEAIEKALYPPPPTAKTKETPKKR
ncbi:MAG TPA: hypothetical protein VKD90_12935 [Gemmataceae bacterium]|nr:hypothetical protein [Gemmataceae bacterium]